MKITLISPYSFNVFGGVNQQVCLLAKQYAAAKHEVWVCGPGQLKPSSNYKFMSTGNSFQFPFAHGSTAHIQFFINPNVSLKKILTQTDIFHIHEPLMPGLSYWIMKNLKNHPKIATFHAYHPFNWKYFLLSPFLKQHLKSFSKFFAVSALAKQMILQFFELSVHIIPNGIELKSFPKVTKNNNQVIFLGRINDLRKGLQFLIQAFESLIQTPLKLNIIGAGDPSLFQKYISRHAKNKIKFLGRLSESKMSNQLLKGKFLVAPSLGNESFGVILLEAMIHGLIVIASDIPAYRAVLEDGKYGILVPPRSSKKIEESLRALYLDPARCDKIQKLAYAYVKKYSAEVLAKKYMLAMKNSLKEVKNV